MKYPRLCNWLSFKKVSADRYLITDNLLEEEYEAGPEVVRFARKLDGTQDPYDLESSLTRREVRNLLLSLRKADLIRDSNVVMAGDGMFMYTLWIPKRTAVWKHISTTISRALMLLWLPVLILGIVLFSNSMFYMDTSFSVAGLLAGLLSGMVFHELGHGCTAVSYGIPVFEFGFMISMYFIPGAYTLMDERKGTRLQRIQILAAGVEMNFLLTGAFLAFASLDWAHGGFWFFAAMTNISLGLFNLVLYEGLDGARIFIELLGGDYEGFTDDVHEIVRKPAKRRILRKKGLAGHAMILLSYLITASRMIMIPVILIIDILVIFGGLQ